MFFYLQLFWRFGIIMGFNPCNHALTRADRWCQSRIFVALFGIFTPVLNQDPVCFFSATHSSVRKVAFRISIIRKNYSSPLATPWNLVWSPSMCNLRVVKTNNKNTFYHDKFEASGFTWVSMISSFNIYTWRIIPISKWLITLLSFRPLSKVVGPLPNGLDRWLRNFENPNYLRPSRDKSSKGSPLEVTNLCIQISHTWPILCGVAAEYATFAVIWFTRHRFPNGYKWWMVARPLGTWEGKG